MEYNEWDLPVYLESGGKRFVRHSIRVTNANGECIVGSLYTTDGTEIGPTLGGPCVVYMHGNASCQQEGQYLIPNLCPHGVSLFLFDAVGCGRSTGEYISLGLFEARDVEYLIDFLQRSFQLGPFALWGRSMGGATAVLTKHSLVRAIVVDSSFSSLPELVRIIAAGRGLPRLAVKCALAVLRRRIRSTVGFDIYDVQPIECVPTRNVPALFGHAERDTFIPHEQGKQLYEAYGGAKKAMVTFSGGHNSPRRPEWIAQGVTLILEAFGIDTSDFQVVAGKKLREVDFHFESYQDMKQAET